MRTAARLLYMNERHRPETDPSQPMVYQIRLQGHLGRQWTELSVDVTITLEDNGETVLTRLVVDQAALYGPLRKVRDLGLPLISVTPVKSAQAGGPDVKPQIETSYSERRSTFASTSSPSQPPEIGR
jgi:hypothetical protein